MGDIGRELITLCEIDIDYCRRTYGQGLCGASLAALSVHTNLALWSEQFTNAYWSNARVTISADTTAAPSDDVTADTVTDTTDTGAHWVGKSGYSFASGVGYTISAFFKAGTVTQFQMQLGNGGTPFPTVVNWRARFDLSTGTIVSVGSNVTAKIEPDLDGWYRCSISGTAQATATDTIFLGVMVVGGTTNYTGTGSGTIRVWGGQFETGLVLSNYKKTTTSAVSGNFGGDAHKCFNGYATCSYRAAFAKEAKAVRYGVNVSGLPVDQAHIFPALRGVSTRAAEINLSGVDPNSTALGKRAKVTVQFDDFADTDLTLDKYAQERVTGAAQADGIGYFPQDRSTHFRKMRVRFPYYNGRGLRVLNGYAGDVLSSYTTRHYVISEWDGPDAAGRIKIVAKDVFDLADNDKAVLPALSRGMLAADISDVAGSATLEPAGVGAEYAASGRICIGGEVMTFTRSGDVLTLTSRGRDGTAAEDHDAGDLVQECVRFDGEDLPNALYRVLTEGGTGAVPASQIDLPEWRDEAVGWLGGVSVTATLTEPIARKKLAGELCQLGALIWPDEVAQQIRFRANRPIAPGETAYPLTDDGSFIEKTGLVVDDVDERISRVFLWHGMRDPTGSVSGASNMNRGAVGWNVEAEGPNEYDETRIQQITTRWLGRIGNDAVASTVAERLTSRYRDTPRTFSGSIDDVDARNLSLGSICLVTTPLIVDAVGLPLPSLMQVRYIEATVPGHRSAIKLQTFTFDGRFGFLMTDGDPEYDAATDLEKSEGCYMIDEAETDFGDGLGPYVIF